MDQSNTTIFRLSTNIFTISTCDLNTKFNDKSHTDWSKTNLISIVTLDGIYILEPQLEKPQGPYKIELIKNPSQKFKHDALEGMFPIFDEQLQSMDNKQYLGVFLDPALTTNTNKLSLDTCPRRFRLAKWSPIIDTYPRQCLLTAITVDYQLLVFHRRCGLWLLNVDLSRDYDRIWVQMNKKAEGEEDSQQVGYETIRQSLHSLSFCNLCWMELDDGRGGPLLLASTITGDIVVWRANTNRRTEYKGHSFELKTILRTQQEYITSMQIYQSLLVASSRNGEVILYDLSRYLDEFVTNKSENPVRPTQPNQSTSNVKSLALIQLFPSAILWHRDGIEVADFYLQKLNEQKVRIILAKSTNICWCTIHYTRQTDQEPAKLAIGDSFSAIDGLDPDVSLHQTPASWLRQAGDRKAVLIADDGSFFQLEFAGDDADNNQGQDASPAFSVIRTDKLDLTDMIPRGLCTSPNGHLITMISSVTFLYDPIRVPNPTKLITLPTWNDKRFFEESMEKVTDERWLRLNAIRSPVDVCDRLDYVRSIFPLLSAGQLDQIHQTLAELATKLTDHHEIRVTKGDQFKLVMLKIINFMQMKLRELSNFKMIDGDQQVYLMQPHSGQDRNHIQDVIFMHYIEQILEQQTRDDDDQDDDQDDDIAKLEPEQVNSLRNYCKWLQKCSSCTSSASIVYDKYTCKFDKIDKAKYGDFVGQETCPICAAVIPFEWDTWGACENQHRFLRCSRSLLVLDLNKYDELECDHCHRHYLSKLIFEPANADDLWLCLYCQ